MSIIIRGGHGRRLREPCPEHTEVPQEPHTTFCPLLGAHIRSIFVWMKVIEMKNKAGLSEYGAPQNCFRDSRDKTPER